MWSQWASSSVAVVVVVEVHLNCAADSAGLSAGPPMTHNGRPLAAPVAVVVAGGGAGAVGGDDGAAAVAVVDDDCRLARSSFVAGVAGVSDGCRRLGEIGCWWRSNRALVLSPAENTGLMAGMVGLGDSSCVGGGGWRSGQSADAQQRPCCWLRTSR